MRSLSAMGVVIALGFLAPEAAVAEVDLDKTDACLAQKMDLGQNPAQCVNDALFSCTQEPPERHNVASLCFSDAQKAWDAGIEARMKALRESASEEIATLAAIELKYDLLIARAQCDRVKELWQASGEQSPEVMQRQFSQCYATAAGLAYVRLQMRAAANSDRDL